MEFRGLIPLLSPKFQRQKKKMLPVMKLVCIYQTHILHPSVNKGVTAGEVRHFEKVSSASTSCSDANVRRVSSVKNEEN